MFCLFYNGKTKTIQALNGSGRAPANITLEETRRHLKISDAEPGSIPLTSPYAVTAPGAAAGWIDTVERFGSGKVTLTQILQPAMELAEKGYPVSEISSYYVRAEPSLN
jgi:gamma-glutamyltranspeptidase/glutathione hydrolase